MSATPKRRWSASRDTADDAATVQTDVMRRLGGPRRMAIALRMSDELAEVAKAGERARSDAARHE